MCASAGVTWLTFSSNTGAPSTRGGASTVFEPAQAREKSTGCDLEGHCDLVHSPWLGHKFKAVRNCLLANIPRGEHELDVGPPLADYLGQFGTTHPGQSDIDKKLADLWASLEQSQRMMPVIGVENGEAEGLEHANRSRAGQGIVLNHQHSCSGHGKLHTL